MKRTPPGLRSAITRWLVVLWVAFGLLLGSGCDRIDRTRPDSKFVLVFVDVSGSALADRDVFRRAWHKIVCWAQQGDRIVLARISDTTLTTFDPVCDEEIARTEWYEEATIKRRHRLATWKKTKLEPAIERALAVAPSRLTEIMNALLVAEKVFGHDRRRRVLVMLSDMIEDCREMNLKSSSLGPTAAAKIIAQRRTQRRLPCLKGVRVYVAGATAPTARQMLAIQTFWIAYCQAAGATLYPSDYGYCLLDFEGMAADQAP